VVKSCTPPTLGHAAPVTTFAYDLASNLLSVTNARGFVTSFAYDALNREAKRIEALGTADERTITSVYDANSNFLARADCKLLSLTDHTVE
jgi:YD repeat-containing protein